jgi:uncharacterized protein with PQ loop repeat
MSVIEFYVICKTLRLIFILRSILLLQVCIHRSAIKKEPITVLGVCNVYYKLLLRTSTDELIFFKIEMAGPNDY